MKIKQIKAREILDSRGVPTIECLITLCNGHIVRASVPAGASVGKQEAYELRDGDSNRFMGKGVLKAIENIEKIIAPTLIEKKPDFFVMDKQMIELDGTKNKSRLGANAILAVSMAIVRAQAADQNVSLWKFIQFNCKKNESKLPLCMFNIINGGAHANNNISFQEFMIMPKGQETFSEHLHVAFVIYHKLKQLLHEVGHSTSVGDEGGFSPTFKNNNTSPEKAALDFLMQAIEQSGFTPGEDVVLCIDVAANHFFDEEKKEYFFDGDYHSSNEIVDFYEKLTHDYPIFSIEDGMNEEDLQGWQQLTECLGSSIQLIGDDIFVSCPTLIKQGIENNVANAVLIKPNQVGTISEAFEAITTAKIGGYKTVISHRSGETNDTFIADLAVGGGGGGGEFKAGAPARGERIAKYNRLLEIEEEIKKQDID
jgi:enolase